MFKPFHCTPKIDNSNHFIEDLKRLNNYDI